MQGMSKWDDATISRHCSTVSIGLAEQRAKMQLLPALTILAGRKQALSSTEKNGAGSDDTAHASSASATPIIPITSRVAEPSAERIESLLSLLEGANGHSNERMVPSLRMVFPQPGGRLSGGVVPFSGEITLGAALTASLDAANAKTVHTRDTHPISAEQRQFRNDIGSSSSPGSGEHKHAVLASSDIDACVVRVIVDDVLVSTVPIDAAKSADDTGSSDAEATLAIQTAVQPTYESNARCSEHPAKEAVAAPTEGRGAWPDNEVAYHTCFKTFGPSKGFTVNTNDCVDLVTSAIAAKRVDLYYIMSARLNAYLDSINPDFSILGNTGANPEKVEALGAIARKGGRRLSTICEVGFNAGHSSLNWLLSSHPSTNILAFDLGEYDYMEHALDFLSEVFPGRLTVVVGDSAVTVPAYATSEEMAGRDPRVCGVVFVDGDHSEEGAYTDIFNLQALTSRNWHVLAIDDFEDPPVQAGWVRYREDGVGVIDHVVSATGCYFAHVSESGGGGSHMRMDDLMHNFFSGYGHFSLGVGTYLLDITVEDVLL
eukprot:g4208.t1